MIKKISGFDFVQDEILTLALMPSYINELSNRDIGKIVLNISLRIIFFKR